MKFLVLLMAVFGFSNVFSSSDKAYNWSLVDHQRHYGDNLERITEITNQFPVVLKNRTYTPNDLDFVSVIEQEYLFDGETTCSSDDSRLKKYVIEFMACPKNDPINCFYQFKPIFSNQDPCL